MEEIMEEIQESKPNKSVDNRRENGTFGPHNNANPNGRPVGLSITELIRQKLLEMKPDATRSAAEMLAENIIQDALENNNKMRTLIWNYMDGMPNQKLEHTGGIDVMLKLDPQEEELLRSLINKQNK